MSLFYKAVRSNIATKTGAKLWHLNLVKTKEIVCTQQLGELIAEKASLTPGDVHNVIRNLMSVMREQLLNSRTVRLDGLGTFTLIAHTKGKGVEKAEEVGPEQITYLRCQFTAEYTESIGGGRTRALTNGVKFTNVSQLDTEIVTPPAGDNTGGDDPTV